MKKNESKEKLSYICLRDYYDSMKRNVTYRQSTMVIEKPSKPLLDFVGKLRERKLSQQESLRNQKEISLKVNV